MPKQPVFDPTFVPTEPGWYWVLQPNDVARPTKVFLQYGELAVLIAGTGKNLQGLREKGYLFHPIGPAPLLPKKGGEE